MLPGTCSVVSGLTGRRKRAQKNLFGPSWNIGFKVSTASSSLVHINTPLWEPGAATTSLQKARLVLTLQRKRLCEFQGRRAACLAWNSMEKKNQGCGISPGGAPWLFYSSFACFQFPTFLCGDLRSQRQGMTLHWECKWCSVTAVTVFVQD